MTRVYSKNLPKRPEPREFIQFILLRTTTTMDLMVLCCPFIPKFTKPLSYLSKYTNDTDGDDEDDEQVDESKVFETGQIIKIHVENFMCHRKFTMDFGRHLNFINGANGSGQSQLN
jgi:hypothetical protein